MSEIRVNKLINEAGTGSVELTQGATLPAGKTITGSGSINLSGAVTATALTGTPDITVGAIVGTNATLSGNLTVNGTTTTIDTAVTAVDSLEVDGNINVGAGLSAYGYKIEQGTSDTTSNIGATHSFNLGTGHIQRFSAASGSNYSPNFRIDASTTLNSKMNVGDVTAATLIVASSSHYCLNTIQVDGTQVGVTTSWIGGSAPSAANGSGFDIYAFTIMKTASTPTYHIIANATSAA